MEKPDTTTASAASPPKSPSLLSSLVKACDILDILIQTRERPEAPNLKEIGGRLDLPMNTTHAILKTLCHCGYAEQAERGRYRIGPRLHPALEPLRRPNFEPHINEIREFVARCAKEQGEHHTCSILENGERRILTKATSIHPVQIDESHLASADFYTKASSRILTAYADPFSRAAVLQRHGQPGDQWPEASDPDRFESELRSIRRLGVVVLRRVERDIVAIACPVLDADGSCLAALGSYAPAYRVNRTKEKAWVAHLRTRAAELAKILSE